MKYKLNELGDKGEFVLTLDTFIVSIVQLIKSVSSFISHKKTLSFWDSETLGFYFNST